MAVSAKLGLLFVGILSPYYFGFFRPLILVDSKMEDACVLVFTGPSGTLPTAARLRGDVREAHGPRCAAEGYKGDSSKSAGIQQKSPALVQGLHKENTEASIQVYDNVYNYS